MLPSVRFEWRTFGLSVGLIACAVAALWTWLPPAYDTNDDVTIRGVLEGTRVPGEPATGFALLPHAALGWVLVSIRSVWPSVYAWDLTITGALVWGMAVFITLAAGHAGTGTVFRATLVLTMIAVLLPLVGSVQYTMSATIAGGASVLLAWSELQGEGSLRRSVLLMALLLLVLGFLVRAGGAMAGALAVGASLVPRGIEARRRGIVTLAGLAALVVTVAAVLYALDLALYKVRPEWDAYRELNELVTALFDWNWQAILPSAVNVSGARAAVGWTPHDWMLLEQAWGMDPALFGVEPVRQFYDATAGQMSRWDYLAATIQRSWTLDEANLLERMRETWPALAALALVAASHVRVRDLGMAIATLVCFAGYCLAVQAGFKSLPFRLLAPMIACFVGLMVATVRVRPRGTATAALVLSLVLVLCEYQAQSAFAAMAANHRHSLQVDTEVATLAGLNPTLVVIHRDTFPEEHWRRPFNRPASRLVAIRLGRNNQNPQLLSFLSAAGLSMFPSAICDSPSILVISEPGRLDVLTTHLKERAGRAVTWMPVYSGSFRAWRCVAAPPP
jgi:hypothetical protein